MRTATAARACRTLFGGGTGRAVRTNRGARADLRFQIIGPLGSGGFGAVYEAVDARSGQHVALKELDDASASSIARFKQEFRALSDCHHPNLVSLKELIEDGERWYIVMELVPGSDFLTHVQSGADNDNQRYDEARLRTALRGVAEGLVALHRFGILHRDLKPSNVRVTPEGRAVLLDFGLVTSADPKHQSTHALAIGTVPYMAPEQATRASIGAAADWYAFGVCLFEALTGRRPFEGETAFQILSDKQQKSAPRASTLAPNVPADLDDLCARLLERDPDRRAGARDVHTVLGLLQDELADPASGAAASSGVPFAGREAELLQLTRALARARDGAFKLLLVEGESGVGKSELVAEFLRRARSEEADLAVLHGRCYENEQVSYKAFDGCVDELARLLRRLPERECAQLLPPRAALLGQLFPVLRSVGAIARAPRGDFSADPTARRLEAFAALGTLLQSVAEEQPLMLVIDDLQWADAESFRLLLALAERPEPPPMLIVATIRPPEELEPEVAGALESYRRKHRVDVVPILGLPTQEATALARKLLGPTAPEQYCRMIAEESGGHPLFLSELVQFVRSRDLANRGTLSLEVALRARIGGLSQDARELLEIAALAGRPYGPHILARALGREDVHGAARTLLSAKLFRLRKGQELGCYHDRIRHTAVDMIAKSRLATLHRQLAHALASDPLSDAFEQARHWDRAGDAERAANAYERAAGAALGTLAFMRAAELCARALQLTEDERDERSQRLLTLQAHAVACAGRSADAAVLYERATHRAVGQARNELRARHAQQLIMSGKLEVGVDAIRALLADLGIQFPKGGFATVVQIVWYRLWLALRGDRFVSRPARAGEEQLVFTAEVLGILCSAIAPLHPLVLMLATLRALRFAAKIPLPANVLQLYSVLGWLRALDGSAPAARLCFEKTRELKEQVDDPVALATAWYVEGSAALMHWEYEHAAQCLERAHTLLVARCPDEPYLLRNVRYHLGLAWYSLCQYGRLASESELWIAEARERGDQLSLSLLTGIGYGYLRHLMRDQPDEAMRELGDALQSMPKEPFSFVHLGELLATTNTLLYQGGPAAYGWLNTRVAAVGRPLLLRSPVGRQTLALFGGLSALHAVGTQPARERAALLERARREARRLIRSRAPILRTYGNVLIAQVHLFEGRREQALTAARSARAAAPSYVTHSSLMAQFLEALLELGEESPECQRLLERLRDEGWRKPRSFVRILLPVLDTLARAPTKSEASLVLGRYEVLRTLGEGGFGSVVEVRDVQTDRKLALKELVSKHPRSLERFKQEFRALSDLHHANLVRLEALREHEGTWYIAMELIEGRPLLDYVREGGGVDTARVAKALLGMIEGLSTLHEAGIAHRDVRPDNVLVTHDGRAVLLDFGLIGRLGDERDEGAVGSVEYAAPEQLDGARPSAAADVYALGTCLYQALSNALPFSAATAGELLDRKLSGAVPAPLADAREPLAALALSMLQRDPAARPSLAEVRRQLSARDAEREQSSPRGHVETIDHFAGREEELAVLDSAYERTCDDGLTLVLLEGESGLGKSAVMAEFGRRVRESSPTRLVLRSRCYESEQVAFKAFDGAVDELARALRELPSLAIEALMPKRVALLGQLFPVLSGVPCIAAAPKKGLPADPGTRQRAAIACFVQLLEALSQRFELLFLIDDLQWADADSFRLLRVLLEQRTALPIALVCTVRPDAELSPQTREELALLRANSSCETLALHGLSDDAATELIEELHGGPLAPERAARLLQEAKGHPLFLRELVEQERSGGATEGALTLDKALAARIARFDDSARTLLSLIALAGKPYGMHVFARALSSPEPSREARVALLGSGFLRKSGADGLAVYHDRIARAVLDQLAPEQLRELARKLALALDAERDADDAERARLWDAAGDAARAERAYQRAGDGALAALQFTAAAQHFARALALRGDLHDEGWRSLLTRHAEALSRAGRAEEAAHAYESAAASAEGEERVRLRIAAVEQTIHLGDGASSLAAARALLHDLGLPAPAKPAAALARAAWNRACVRLRGYGMDKPRAALAPRVRSQLDAAWSLALPLSWLDPLASAALTTQHLRLALASGEPSHVARALAAEAFARAVRSPATREIDELLARARELALRHGDPALETEITYREGAVATYRWDLALASDRLELALQSVTERCPDQPWLTTNIRLALGAALFNRREHQRLARTGATWLAEARDRNDRFALTNLNGLGYAFVRHLMADQPAQLEAEFEEHRAWWPKEPFSFVHFGDLIATTYGRLYIGGDAALSWFEREEARLARALLIRPGTGRGVVLMMRAAAHLAAYTSGARAGDPALLERTSAITDQLARLNTVFGLQIAPFLRAQVEAVSGQRERALARLHDVQERAAASGYAVHEDRTRYFAAALAGRDDDDTRALLLARYRAQGWKRPRHAFTALCPVLDSIERPE